MEKETFKEYVEAKEESDVSDLSNLRLLAIQNNKIVLHPLSEQLVIGEAANSAEEAALFQQGCKIVIRTDLINEIPTTVVNTPPASSIMMVIQSSTVVNNTPPTSTIAMIPVIS